MTKRGKLAIISGPSGAGKDTMISIFLKRNDDWIQPPSTTTRQPRESDADRNMRFVDKKTFEKWRAAGQFLEAVEVYPGLWYGTLKAPVEELLAEGKNVLLRPDVNGGIRLKQLLPDVITIFVKAESLEALRQRLTKRGTEDAATIEKRLEVAEAELKAELQFDHSITNLTDRLEEAVSQLEKIVA